MQVVDFISDAKSDTHVLLARWSSLLIVAFRGTSSRTNWYSNARFKQVRSVLAFASALGHHRHPAVAPTGAFARGHQQDHHLADAAAARPRRLLGRIQRRTVSLESPLANGGRK